MQLQENLQAFRDAGIAVVALTYDAPALQQQFIKERGIEYPLLSDIEAYSIKALGILDAHYQPGEQHYGIPHPGIFILSPDMKIVGKVFVQGYKKRVTARAVLTLAKELLNETAAQ